MSVTAIRTDHNAITLEIDSLDDQQRGPSFWKFNNSLLDDALFSVYVKTFQSGSMKLTSQEIDQKLEIDFFSKC